MDLVSSHATRGSHCQRSLAIVLLLSAACVGVAESCKLVDASVRVTNELSHIPRSSADVAVATYSDLVFLFAAGETALELVDSVTAPFAEATAAAAGKLLAVRNNCVCPSLNGISDASCCIASMEVQAFTWPSLDIDAAIHTHGVTCPSGPLCGAIFTHVVNATLVAVANYIGGYATFFDLATARSWQSTPVSASSLMHHLVPDTRCSQATADRLFGVDAGNYSVLTLDLRGAVLQRLQHTKRIRRLTLHPKLEFAYLLYEADGEFGVWRWPDCTSLGEGMPPVELSVQATLPAPVTMNKPTSLLVTRDGRFLYTCTRTHYVPGAPNYVGVFNVSAGTPQLVRWVPVPGNNTRDCALVGDDSLLVAADVASNALLPFRIDAATGDLTPMSPFTHESFAHPTMVVPL